MKRESGEPITDGNSGAVPAAVSPLSAFFIKKEGCFENTLATVAHFAIAKQGIHREWI
jgi:hypothetical protein